MSLELSKSFSQQPGCHFPALIEADVGLFIFKVLFYEEFYGELCCNGLFIFTAGMVFIQLFFYE